LEIYILNTKILKIAKVFTSSMDTIQISMGFLVLAAGIGFLGSLSANYFWWWLTSDIKKRKWWHHTIGIFYILGFLFLFLYSFLIFLK